jgi:hypothetical protein
MSLLSRALGANGVAIVRATVFEGGALALKRILCPLGNDCRHSL